MYGSLARGDYHAQSDINICVRGLPNKCYFRAFAECIMKSQCPVSILDFESTYGYLQERIIEEGKIIAMNVSKLKKEIDFGLEDSEKVYQNILKFTAVMIVENQDIKVVTLAYECFGY